MTAAVAPGIAPVAASTVLLAIPPVLSKVDVKTATRLRTRGRTPKGERTIATDGGTEVGCFDEGVEVKVKAFGDDHAREGLVGCWENEIGGFREQQSNVSCGTSDVRQARMAGRRLRGRTDVLLFSEKDWDRRSELPGAWKS